MQIDKKEGNGRVTLVINGELDAETSPDLEKELSSMEGVTDLSLTSAASNTCRRQAFAC